MAEAVANIRAVVHVDAQSPPIAALLGRKIGHRLRQLLQHVALATKTCTAPREANEVKQVFDRSRSRESSCLRDPIPTLASNSTWRLSVCPTAVVDFGEGFRDPGVQIFDLNTGKRIRVYQRTIASYHWLCSIDFHNVLDVSRPGVHVAWQGPFPQLFEDVKRALVPLHYIGKRANERTAFCSSAGIATPIPRGNTCSRLFPTRVRHSLVKQVPQLPLPKPWP